MLAPAIVVPGQVVPSQESIVVGHLVVWADHDVGVPKVGGGDKLDRGSQRVLQILLNTSAALNIWVWDRILVIEARMKDDGKMP